MVGFLRKNKVTILFYGLLFILTLLYLMKFKIDMSTDDGWFMEVHKKRSLFDYLHWRYNCWSARLFPEAMLYLIFMVPLLVHHVISACAWFLYSFSLVRIFNGTVSRKNFLVAFLSLGLMDICVMKNSLFWITGAINYLWPLALGLFSLIPYADNFFRNKKTVIWPYIIPALIFSFSNEQLLVCVIGVVLVYHIAILVKKKKENFFLLLPTILFLLGFIFMFFAPGNTHRMKQEIIVWMPDFDKLPLFLRILKGSSWLFEGWQTKLLLLFILILVISLTIDASKTLSKITAAYTVFLCLLAYNFPHRFMNFHYILEGKWVEPLKAGNLFNKALFSSLLPYVLWGSLFGLVIVVSILVAEKKVFIGLSYCAALFAAAMLWFSPTMYASGARVFMCSSIFLIIILYILYQQTLENKNIKAKNQFLFYACFIPALNLLFVFL
ncbi:hypothetical protein GIX45_28065 [Erwinia sp. CPCC 100877]|nr:hypothetical protein [Erwinia sp. CPCC 100877]